MGTSFVAGIFFSEYLGDILEYWSCKLLVNDTSSIEKMEDLILRVNKMSILQIKHLGGDCVYHNNWRTKIIVIQDIQTLLTCFLIYHLYMPEKLFHLR